MSTLATSIGSMSSVIVNNMVSKLHSLGGKTEKTEMAHVKTDDGDIYGLNPRGRIDFSVEEGLLDNPYLSMLAAHVGYWCDQDMCVFMLKELYS